MAAVVWRGGAYRVRRLGFFGFFYMDRVDGYWWMSLNGYNSFETSEEAEAAWHRSRPRKIKQLKAKGAAHGQA